MQSRLYLDMVSPLREREGGGITVSGQTTSDWVGGYERGAAGAGGGVDGGILHAWMEPTAAILMSWVLLVIMALP